MKIIILGIGNLILGDDGIGIKVLRELKKKIKRSDIVFDEAMTGGMNLLDIIKGYDKAILIDAIYNPKTSIGDVKRFSIQDCPTAHSCNPHDVSLSEAIQLAEQLGEKKIPDEIIIIGIVLHKIPTEFSEAISPKVKTAIPKAVQIILNEIQ